MKRIRRGMAHDAWLGLAAATLLAVGCSGNSQTTPLARVSEAYGKLPMAFEANRGQTEAEVKFLARGRGYTVFLTATEAVLVLRASHASDTAVVRMRILGANPASRVAGLDELPGKSNYFLGNDPGRWRTEIPTYAKVKYEVVYPGVDLVFYGTQRELEADFIVAPGADPKAIRLGFEGVEAITVDARGDLVLRTAAGELRLHRPQVYQEVGGLRREIPAGYRLRVPGEVGFAIAAYDAGRPLVIDPVLSYSTYLGGTATDQGRGIAVDAAGNAYVTGQTSSMNFPTANALQASLGGGIDAFVTKLNAAGSGLVYSTYLGGIDDDVATGIAVDAGGNAYVTGSTDSINFPTTPGAFQTACAPGCGDAFVTKLNAAGSALVYSTYLGGSLGDVGNAIAVDAAGNAHVTGQTISRDFPTANPLQPAFGGFIDAFVTKLNAAGSALAYSTYLGGSSTDVGSAIAVDAAGNAYVTGQTASPDFPTVNALQPTLGVYDAFVTKLNAAGSTVYSTYLGGSFPDYGYAIAVDGAGAAYVTGLTFSTDFPTLNAVQPTFGGSLDAFVTKLNPAGSALVYSTYLGGSGDESGNAIAVDAAGQAHVTGESTSANFPTANAVQPAPGGGRDAFVTKLNAAGSALVYSTYLGGSGNDRGRGIAVDAAGNAYLTGQTLSSNFPTTAGAFQQALGGVEDVFIAKIADVLALTLATNAAAFRTGDSLVISVAVDNPGLAQTVDFYFGALLPDGDTIVFFTDLNFNSGSGRLSAPATLRPIAAGVNLATPFVFSQPTFFPYRWAGTEPAGSYVLFVAAVKPGALADNSLDAGDLVVLATAVVTFAP